MSSIGGGCFLTKLQSVRKTADTLAISLKRTGPDQQRFVVLSDAMIGHGAFHISQEDYATACQPIVWNQHLYFAWDGRLDNREELTDILCDIQDDSDRAKHTCYCDAHLALRAYLKWGEECATHLIGDYAFSLWDSANRRLYLARDPFGIRPLYVMRKGHETWWCSDIAFLLEMETGASILDEEYVAGYLTTTEEPSRTPYNNIKSVSPGCLVVVDSHNANTRPFWSPQPRRSLKYNTDRQYEEHCRGLFEDSLKRRLRAKGTVMAELSGGLDSSAIVCMGDRLIKEGLTEATRLETVSFIYDRSKSADERAFIAEVIAPTGVTNHHIIDDRILSPAPEQAGYFIPNPHRSYLDTYVKTEQQMQRAGARVLLTGMCGDHVFMHEPTYNPILAEMLAQGKLGSMHRLAMWISQRRKASYWQTLWLGAMWPWLPPDVRVKLSPEKMRLPEWIQGGFITRTQCGRRNLLREPALATRNPCLQQRVSLICNAVSASAAQRYREHQCIEASMPYLHLPLVQFLLDIPSSQFLRIGEDRSLQRRSMVGIMPEAVRTRTSKSSPDESFLRAVRKQWSYLSDQCRDPIMAQLGIVDRRKFLLALERARSGHAKYLGSLFRTLSFELWLRQANTRLRFGL